MELKKAIESRTSIRNFRPEPLPVDDIREIVRLAGLAPSINNYQPWSFILISDKQILARMAAIISGKLKTFPVRNILAMKNIMNQVEWYSTFFKDAPAVIALVMNEYETVWEKGVDLDHKEINQIRNYPDIQSAGACIQNLLLAATDMGYGSCWLGGPMVARKELEEILAIQQPSWLLSFIALGFPVKTIAPKEKEDKGKEMRII